MTTKTVFASLCFTACVPGSFGGSTTLSAYGPRPTVTAQPAPTPAPLDPGPTPDFVQDEPMASTADIAEVTAPIGKALRSLAWMAYNADLSQASSGIGEALIADARACIASIEAAAAMGVPATTVIEGQGLAAGSKIKLAEATKVCDVLLTRAMTWEADIAAAQTASTTKLAAPYRAAGIGGDKLDLLLRHEGYGMQGIGGAELTSPKQLADASVIFELMKGGDAWTLRSYRFRGNTLVATTEQAFPSQPDASKYR